MTTPMCEDSGPLKEWSPLALLLQQIPAKIKNGIFTQDLNLTCIDAVPEFIAIGTNYGLVYWYDREKGDLQRLRCENANAAITCVRVISTVDFMVAAGNDHGMVTIFQIPKNPPDSLPDSLKPKQKKQVERYSISGLHKSAVTTVEWSKNGMKLFSGDHEGLVVLTEIDFYMHLSKSSELLNEKYSTVQLSYRQGILLVSTLFRTILVDIKQNNKVSQVGQKERKTLGKLGAVFSSRQTHVQEPIIYASRPGLRLWQANHSGTVLKTLIFKDAIRKGHTEVELLNPAPECTKKNRGEESFGVLLPFHEDLLVTYSEDVVYVVNPTTIAITSIVNDLRRVTDVACTNDEIFVLEGQRNIIRIGYHPESNNFATGTKAVIDPLASIAEISKPVTSGLLELTSKLKESSIVPAIPFPKINASSLIQSVGILPNVNIGTDVTTVTKAEEALEIPPVVPLDLPTPLITKIDTVVLENSQTTNTKEEDKRNSDRRRIFQKISEQEFEDVVFTPERRAKKTINKSVEINENLTTTTARNPEKKTTHSSLLALSIDDDFILNSGRSLETIRKDVENKEKLLADVLNFDLSEYMTSSRISDDSNSISNSINTITCVNCDAHTIVNNDFPDENPPSEIPVNENEDIENENEVLALNDYENHEAFEDEGEEDDDDDDDDEEYEDDESYATELNKLKDLGDCSKQLLKRNSKPELNNDAIQKKLVNMDNVETGQDLEVNFNVLSKEFVTSAILEGDDWVVIEDPDPSGSTKRKL